MTVKIVGISGSLRHDSYNTAALRAAQQLTPDDTQVEIAGKSATVMSASMSLFGGARAQYDLRRILIFLDVHFINKPEMMIAQAHQRFDANGALPDKPTLELSASC